MMPSSICVVTNCRISFFFSAEYYSTLYVVLICSSVHEHWDSLHFLGSVMNRGVQVSPGHDDIISFRHVPSSEVSGSFGCWFYFWGTSIWLSIMAVLICIFTLRARTSFSPPPHQHLLSLDFLTTAILTDVMWYFIVAKYFWKQFDKTHCVFWIVWFWWDWSLNTGLCAWATPPIHFALIILEMESLQLFAQAVLTPLSSQTWPPK
jgi:hypothetical protein